MEFKEIFEGYEENPKARLPLKPRRRNKQGKSAPKISESFV